MDKKETFVIKSNRLIESRYTLPLNEIKLFITIISKIEYGDTDLKTCRIHINDFAFGENRTDKYSRAIETCKNLRSKTLVLEMPEGPRVTGFINIAQFHKGKGYVDITIDPRLKDDLIKLRGKFTKYILYNILQMRSSYTIRLYQLLKSYEKLGKRVMDLHELKRVLMVEEKYSRYFDFRQRILEPAKKEMDRVSADIRFQYKPIKTGRTITAIEFIILENKQMKLNFQPVPDTERPTVEWMKEIRRKRGIP